MSIRWKTLCSTILVLLSWLAAIGSVLRADQATVLLKARLEPGNVVNTEPSQLIVELQPASPISGLHLEIVPPVGFQVKPSALIDLPMIQGHYTMSSAFIIRSDTHAEIGAHTVYVRAVNGPGPGATMIADGSVSFDYVSRISIWVYFLLGGVGILIGYCLRIFVKVLQSVPEPSPQPPGAGGGQAPGPITRFVQKHYYFVDCGVTLVVGLISLSLLVKNNHVPDSGLYWYSTLGSGVALGLLTNSELLSKLR